MASFWSFLAIFMVFMAYFSSLAVTSQIHAQFSIISAAPAFLPDAPSSSPPSLSPDIEPLFPTPRAGAPSPSESLLPTIPSSLSPPNPDDMPAAPGPDLAIAPSGSLQASSSVPLASSGPLNLAVLIGLMCFAKCSFLVCEVSLSGSFNYCH